MNTPESVVHAVLHCTRRASLVLALFLAIPAAAQEASRDTADRRGEGIVVALKPAAPFVMRGDDGEWDGIAVELWRRVARDAGVDYTFREADIEGLIDAVEAGEVSVGVAALTVTAERERQIDFTHPYYHGGLGIAVPIKPDGLGLRAIFSLFSPPVLAVIGGLALLLLGVGFIVWLAERRRNADQFGGGVVHGLANGFWFSAVTMTTVGYGDKAPVSPVGRFVTLIWMFTSIIVISFFTGGIASAITAAQLSSDIRGPEDLDTARIGAIEGTATLAALRARGIQARRFETIDTLLDALDEGKIDAAVHDAALLAYRIYADERPARMLEATFQQQPYAFALPPADDRREQINRAILDVIASDDWQAVTDRYLAGG